MVPGHMTTRRVIRSGAHTRLLALNANHQYQYDHQAHEEIIPNGMTFISLYVRNVHIEVPNDV